jgi:hypothetical protein
MVILTSEANSATELLLYLLLALEAKKARWVALGLLSQREGKGNAFRSKRRGRAGPGLTFSRRAQTFYRVETDVAGESSASRPAPLDGNVSRPRHDSLGRSNTELKRADQPLEGRQNGLKINYIKALLPPPSRYAVRHPPMTNVAWNGRRPNLNRGGHVLDSLLHATPRGVSMTCSAAE